MPSVRRRLLPLLLPPLFHHGMSMKRHFPMSTDTGKCMVTDIPW